MIALAAGASAFAQEPSGPVLAKVEVVVDGLPAPAPIAGLVALKAGDAYSRMAVDQAVKAVFRTGLFSDVRVEKSGEAAVDLKFLLIRNLIVDKVRFKGIRVRASRLRQSMETLRIGSVFDADLVPKAVDEVKAGLRAEGYFGAAVEAVTKRRDAGTRLAVTFDVSGTKRYRIASVDLRGPLAMPRYDLERRMKSRAGALYVPARLDRDIQNLLAYYGTLGYRRAEITRTAERFNDGAGTVNLELDVQPREKIVIVINGAKLSPALVAPLWQERIFEEWGLAEGEVRVLNALRKKGYVLATVKSRIDHTADEVRVVYDVTPGLKYRIRSVVFQGNQAFSAKRLKDEVTVSERVLFFSALSYDRVFTLPREIEYFYKTQGYANVRADLDLRKTDGAVDAVIRISEGPRQIVRSMTFEGMTLFPPAEILRQLLDKVDGPLFQPNVQRDIGIIETAYLNRGLRGTTVAARLEDDGDNVFSVIFEVQEGRPVTVSDIVIAGNHQTRTAVIAREIQVAKGAPADYAKIQDTRRRLERLGIFSEIRADEVELAPGREGLIVNVQEGDANYAGLGFGFETKNDKPTFEMWRNQYSPKVTAEYIRYNVFGSAAQLSLVGQYSIVDKRAIVSWTQPYLFGLPLQPSLLGWIEKEVVGNDFSYNRHGISFNLTRPLAPNLLLITTLSWSRTRLFPMALQESEIDVRLRNYATALASASVAWDRRDDSLNPTKGIFVSAVAQIATPVFGTESDYWKTFFKFQYFRPLSKQLFFGLTSRVGLCQGLIAIPERFFAGGSSSFRGESFDQLGPKDDFGNPVGGRALFLVNAELTFPLVPALRDLSGAVFTDIGNVFTNIGDFRFQDLEEAAGLGLRYKTPLGPVRFELAWNLHTPASFLPAGTRRKRTAYLFITIGNVF